MLLDDRDLLGACLRCGGETALSYPHSLGTQALRQGHRLKARQLLICYGEFGREEGMPARISGQLGDAVTHEVYHLFISPAILVSPVQPATHLQAPPDVVS